MKMAEIQEAEDAKTQSTHLLMPRMKSTAAKNVPMNMQQLIHQFHRSWEATRTLKERITKC